MFALVSETYSVVSRLSPGTAGMINILYVLLLVLYVVEVGSAMLPYRMQEGGDERGGRRRQCESCYVEKNEHDLP